MRTVTKRELNQRTADVLDQVTDTEDVIVTERGRPRWRVSAIHDNESPFARLERSGRYTPPQTNPVPWPADPGGRTYTSAEVDELLDEMRGDH